HDTGDIERVCDRVIVIHRGRLLWDGTLADLRRSYLTAKRLTLWTEAERLDVGMPGVRVISSHSYRTELEIDADVTSLGSVVVVIVGVFSSLWRATREAGLAIAADPKSLVWYLASTEWILLSAPLMHVDVQEALRRGDVAYQVGRPVSYVGATFAQGLGSVA